MRDETRCRWCGRETRSYICGGCKGAQNPPGAGPFPSEEHAVAPTLEGIARLLRTAAGSYRGATEVACEITEHGARWRLAEGWARLHLLPGANSFSLYLGVAADLASTGPDDGPLAELSDWFRARLTPRGRLERASDERWARDWTQRLATRWAELDRDQERMCWWCGVDAAPAPELLIELAASLHRQWRDPSPPPASPGAGAHSRDLAVPMDTVFAYEVPFETGWTVSQAGNSVAVTSVRGTAPGFELGGRYQVRARYRLASAPEAFICLWLSAHSHEDDAAHEHSGDRYYRQVARGSGEVVLCTTLGYESWPHVHMHLNGTTSALADQYFGAGRFLRARALS